MRKLAPCRKCGGLKERGVLGSKLCAACRGGLTGQQRYLAAHPERRAVTNRRSRIRAFGITPEQYDAMLSAQGGVCAICARPSPIAAALSIDHDHATGRVRGLLCVKCNTAIGKLNDDADLVLRAAAYLRGAA